MLETTNDFENIIGNISNQLAKINLEGSRISSLHIFFNYVHLKKIMSQNIGKKYIQDDKELFTKLKMLPSLKKLTYTY